MEFALAAVVLLFVLAASDLVVGVSNDAVNFLNSAIGSRVAPRRTIMVVASLGIVLGATFASGLMEVARKGIFNPELFTFTEVMAIFLAVMLTDILLLDLFNTYGLPTSTTVSIVFELLGAAVAVALFRLTASGESWSLLPEFINSAKAGEIIGGIFLSVGVAFTVGAVVMFVARLLFTFRYGKTGQVVHILWSGIALTAIAYFLLIKGLKGASFVPDGFRDWTQNNTLQVLAVVWALMTVLAGVLSALRVSLLHGIVLAGTFALAMAFAGNDLVNFIGVPLAGMESYKAWTASGLSGDAFTMEVLALPYKANTGILLLAGAIMAVTLWTSRKARRVTDTEVNLARADAGTERFKGNWIARGVVRLAYNSSKVFGATVPSSWAQSVEARFAPAPAVPNPPAFDLVRASVNLTVASVLIAIATNMKLPLSTTYVSFMVAMGSSLADRAWGRESAVFRVSGVLSVIGGWFLTAAVAFSVAGIFAVLIRGIGDAAVWGLALIAVAALANTFRLHQRRARREEAVKAEALPTQAAVQDPRSESAQDLADLLDALAQAEEVALQAFQMEQRRTLRSLRHGMGERLDRNERQLDTLPQHWMRPSDEKSPKGLGRGRILDHDLRQDMLVSAFSQLRQVEEHLKNLLPPFAPDQSAALQSLNPAVRDFLRKCSHGLRQGREGLHDAFLEELRSEKKRLLTEIDRLLAEQSGRVQQKGRSDRTDALYVPLVARSHGPGSHQRTVDAFARALDARSRGAGTPAHRSVLRRTKKKSVRGFILGFGVVTLMLQRQTRRLPQAHNNMPAQSSSTKPAVRSIEAEIGQTKPFASERHRVLVNLMFTYGWHIERLRTRIDAYGITVQQYNVLRMPAGCRRGHFHFRHPLPHARPHVGYIPTGRSPGEKRLGATQHMSFRQTPGGCNSSADAGSTLLQTIDAQEKGFCPAGQWPGRDTSTATQRFAGPFCAAAA